MHHVLDFDWQGAPRVGEAMSKILNVGDECPRLWRRRLWFVEWFSDHGVEPRLVREVADPDTADAFENDLNVSSRLALRGNDGNERADVMEILRPRIIYIGIAMGSHDQLPVGRQRVIDGAHRSRATNEQGDDVAREDDDVL
jgi:hypothetical protein